MRLDSPGPILDRVVSRIEIRPHKAQPSADSPRGEPRAAAPASIPASPRSVPAGFAQGHEDLRTQARIAAATCPPDHGHLPSISRADAREEVL
jgi:hypothetical protein